MGKNATYNLKLKMLSGEKIYGIEIWDGNDPKKTTSMLKRFGYDFIWLEFENCLLNEETALEYIRHAHEMDMPVLMRPADKKAHFRPYIISGINGVIQSQVENVEDVAYAIKEVYFPPLGRRDATLIPRSIDFQSVGDTPLLTLMEYVNNNSLVMPLCERLACLRSLPHILRLEGVVGAILAPGDLLLDIISCNPQDIGCETLFREAISNDYMKEKIEQLAEICKDAGKVAGIGVFQLEDMAEFAKIGYQLFILGAVVDGNVMDYEAPIEKLKSLIR